MFIFYLTNKYFLLIVNKYNIFQLKTKNVVIDMNEYVVFELNYCNKYFIYNC